MDEEPQRPPSTGLRVMAAVVIGLILLFLVVFPITLGAWDVTLVLIAIVGVAAVGVWAFFGIRASRRRTDGAGAEADDIPPDDRM
jgi:uncharacterized protein YacL